MNAVHLRKGTQLGDGELQKTELFGDLGVFLLNIVRTFWSPEVDLLHLRI